MGVYNASSSRQVSALCTRSRARKTPASKGKGKGKGRADDGDGDDDGGDGGDGGGLPASHVQDSRGIAWMYGLLTGVLGSLALVPEGVKVDDRARALMSQNVVNAQ